MLVLAILGIDLKFAGGGSSHKVTVKEAAVWMLIWLVVALLFNAAIWWFYHDSAGAAVAHQQSAAFLTAYLLEKALAVDNVFVWLIIFNFMAVPAELQRRVLLYGVLGAIALRAVMIFGGSYLIDQFHWLLYLFGAFLLFSGIKMLLVEDEEPDMEHNALLGFLRRHLRLTEHLEGERFFVLRNGLRYATPLFLTLVLVELSDVIFAMDSIPAIFAVTTDPFIVLTSNIFAIMGLRAMYFLLAEIADRFVLLKYGLAAILSFIGLKMLLAHWLAVPISVTLGVIAGILLLTMVLSWYVSGRSPVQ